MSEPATGPIDFDNLDPPKDIPADFAAPDHTKSRTRPRLLTGAKRAVQPVKKATPKKVVPKSKPGQFIETLETIYTGLGLTLMPFDDNCAQIIVENGHRCAEAWDELAQRNDAVRKALYALTETSAFGAVMLAHAPILAAVMSHHGPGKGRTASLSTEDREGSE